MPKRAPKFPKYLGKNHNTYFVELTVPKDVRGVLGTRRFHKSLKTDSLSQAETRKWSYIERWRRLIEAARATHRGDSVVPNADANISLIETWRQRIEVFLNGEPDSDLVAWDAVVDIAQEQGGGTNHPAVLGYKEYTGEIVRLNKHFEGWASTLKPSTKNSYSNAVLNFTKAFPFAHDISESAVTEYFRGLEVSYSSKKVYAAGVRSFADYIDYEHGTELRALIKPDLSREQKNFTKRSRAPWEDEEVSTLLSSTEGYMRDLVRLGMYSGCRISELEGLTKQDVKADRFIIRDSKTDAGRREVPIHPELQQLVARLISAGGERSTLLPKANYGSRFSNLKTSLGFGSEKVFHSFRNTVAKKLLEANVSEVTAASILGHKINTMSYGTYARGAVPFINKEEAMKSIKYKLAAG